MKPLLFCILLLIVLPLPLRAAETTDAVSGMRIRADLMTHETATDLIRADGRVEMTWQDLSMTADRATYNRTTQTLTAFGNVRLTKNGDTLRGDQLVMDTETGRAEMENGRIFLVQGNFHADGKRIARLADDSYALRSGGLTTCDAEVPSWKFGAAELDVTLEEYATGTNVVFYVKDIPVFYFPYVIVPVRRERQSGLLFPRFGTSSKRGTFIEMPFYWAISPSQEATITLDAQTKRGVGLGADYRYLRSRTSQGSLGGYLIYDNNENKERGQLVQFHNEQFSDSLNLVTSINLTSDRTFLQDYSDKNGEYNRQYYDSRVVLTKFWNQWLAGAQAIYTQDFYSSSNTTTLQRAPELSLYGVREAVPGIPRFYVDLDLLLTNYYREKGPDGRRIVLEPRLTTTQELSGGRLNLSLFGGVQLRGYDTDNATGAGIKEDQLIAVPLAGAQISSSFSRLYKLQLLDLQQLRHELVPTLSYRYTGSRDQSSVPVFDHLDRLNAQQTVTLSLASHLGGRIAKQEGTAEYRTLQTLRLVQSYTPSGNRTDLLTLTDDTRPWSDLTLESDTWLHRQFRLLADLRYNHYSHRIAGTAAGFEYNDARGTTGRISYRMADRQLEYLEAGATVALTSPVYLGYTTRYSFDKRDFLESNYTLEYRHQCWSVIVGYQERPNNRTWTVNFNLAGLFGFGTGSPTGYRPPAP